MSRRSSKLTSSLANILPAPRRVSALTIFSHFVTNQASLDLSNIPPLEAMKRILSKPSKDRAPKALQTLINFTKPIRFFAELGDEAHYQCCQYMTYQFVAEGEVSVIQFVFHKGDPGSEFFVLLHGKCGVLVPLVEGDLEYSETMEYRTGDSFGELALMKNQPRAASILCKADCHFGVLEREAFLRIIGKVKEMKLNQKVDFLQKLPLFQRWTKGSLVKLSYFFKERNYRRKQAVFSYGDEAKEIYFITQGEFQVMQTVHIPGTVNALHKFKGSMTLLAEVTVLSIGQFFGEEDVLDDSVRSFTCVCRSTTGEVLVLSKEVRTRQDFMRRVNNEDTLNYLRKMQAQKTNFRQKRLLAISNLEAMKKEATLLSPDAFDISPISQVSNTKTTEHSAKTIKPGILSLAIGRLGKEIKNQQHSESPDPGRHQSPLYPTPLNPVSTEDILKPEPRPTWDDLLLHNMGKKRLVRHVRSSSQKVINMHTEKLRKLKPQEQPKLAHICLSKEYKKSNSAGVLDLGTLVLQPQLPEVHVKTFLRRSPHHLFRIASQSSFR